MIRMKRVIVVCAALCAMSPRLPAQDDVADVPSRERKAGDDERKKYFLVGAAPDAQPPEPGYGLVIVLPGGDGSAEFHPFVKRIYKYAVPEGYLLAQPVAVQWTPKQPIVWPTGQDKTSGRKFTTEEFVSAVIDDVGRDYRLDPNRIVTLSWSSGGPAAYATALAEPRITGSFVAMSVFKPEQLPSLDAAKDRAFFLYHSPDDRVCPYRFVERARKDLAAKGAKVELKTYDGGHGWRGDVFADIREGLEWLEANSAAEKAPAGKPPATGS